MHPKPEDMCGIRTMSLPHTRVNQDRRPSTPLVMVPYTVYMFHTNPSGAINRLLPLSLSLPSLPPYPSLPSLALSPSPSLSTRNASSLSLSRDQQYNFVVSFFRAACVSVRAWRFSSSSSSSSLVSSLRSPSREKGVRAHNRTVALSQ